jgi:AcrR family transcriptional regulator
MLDSDDLTPRQRRHLRTREAILDAARQIIRDEGPEGLSMRQIADRIDYSAAGLYEYFGGKDEIVTAVCQRGHERLANYMKRVDPNLSPAAYLNAIGQQYINFAQQNPDLYKLMFMTVTLPPDREQGGVDDGSYGILLQAVRNGIDSGDFKTRPGYGLQEIAYSAWALVHGISMLRLTYLAHYPADFATADLEALRTLTNGLMVG